MEVSFLVVAWRGCLRRRLWGRCRCEWLAVSLLRGPRSIPSASLVFMAAASSIWLPTGPARWSGLQTDRPLLLIFYHVEKTGGTAVMKYLHKMANVRDKKTKRLETPRLTPLMDFTHTSCMFSLYPELFPTYKDLWDVRQCSGPGKPRWQTSSIAVEFHAY